MKTLLPISCLLATLLLVSACGKKQTTDAARVSGEIKGLGNDTLLVCGMDRLFGRLDTLLVHEDKFADTLPVDTLTGLYLIFSDGVEVPFYADCREHIRIQGSADQRQALQVTGNATNDLLTDFLQELAGAESRSTESVQEKAEAFIRSHPSSAASAYLLEKYFLQTPEPDFKRIEELAKPLTGEVKDRPAMTTLLDFLEERKKQEKGRTLPYFQTIGSDGKKVSRNNFRNQYLLIHFWASWHPASRQASRALRPLHELEKKNKDFALLGISLDMDREAWQEAVRRDTLDWKQCCDLRGWEADAVQRLSLNTLPFNLLVTPKGRILGTNLTAEEVEKAIAEE